MRSVFNSIGYTRVVGWLGALLLVATASIEVQAQFDVKWLAVGSFQHRYSSSGAEPATDFRGLQWPASQPDQDQNVMRALWIGAENFADERGETYSYKVVHAGPRTPGVGQFMPTRFETVSRFPAPEVTVDDLQTFDKFTFVDRVDPSLKADRMIVNVANTQMGVTMKRKLMQFSQEHHDNYHIAEYVFTNTGNIDTDDEIELEQTLKGVYFFLLDGYYSNRQSARTFARQGTGGQIWGQFQMFDFVGDTMEDYEVDFRANYSWQGYIPTISGYDPIGAPVLNDAAWLIPPGDSTGRLSAPQFIGRVTLHADKSANDNTDDPEQPSTTSHISQDEKITQQNSAFDRDQMATEYNFMSQGHVYPHHADLIEAPEEGKTWRERMATGTNDPSDGIAGGYNNTTAYGPYTLEPGDSIRIVMAEGASGLSHQAATVIGERYKKALRSASAGTRAAVETDIEFDADGDGKVQADESMPKNYWVMTGRDSLFQTFKRAIANFQSEYNIPQPPQPPSEFHVSSKPDKIVLDWQTYADANPEGFEVWRASERYYNDYIRVAGPDKLGADARQFEDTGVKRGVSYYYYIQAVGSPNADDTGLTPTGQPMKSSRFYTQTYDPAFLKRSPGSTLDAVTVVPNPYNLEAEENLRWPDQQDKIGFLDIPGQSTIKIYTESGELVKTISHTDGSGDEFWNLTTSSNQLVRSGLYVAVVQDLSSGEQVIRKFTIIR